MKVIFSLAEYSKYGSGDLFHWIVEMGIPDVVAWATARAFSTGKTEAQVKKMFGSGDYGWEQEVFPFPDYDLLLLFYILPRLEGKSILVDFSPWDDPMIKGIDGIEERTRMVNLKVEIDLEELLGDSWAVRPTDWDYDPWNSERALEIAEGLTDRYERCGPIWLRWDERSGPVVLSEGSS